MQKCKNIYDLGLSVRAVNVLKNANKVRISSLINSTEQELLSYKNMGIHTLAEIKLGLKRFRLSLKIDKSIKLGKINYLKSLRVKINNYVLCVHYIEQYIKKIEVELEKIKLANKYVQ